MTTLFLLATTTTTEEIQSNPTVNIFLNGLNNFGGLSTTDAVPKALDKLWDVAMNGNMYKLVCGLGLSIAIFAVGFWCVKFYKTLEEGGLRPAVSDLVLPIILVILLSNGGGNMRDLTLGTRNMMNGINRSVNLVVDSEVNLKTAIRTLATYEFVKTWVEQRMNNCKVEIDPKRLNKCIQDNTIPVGLINAAFHDDNASYSEKARAEFKKWQEEAIAYRNRRMEIPLNHSIHDFQKSSSVVDPSTVKDGSSSIPAPTTPTTGTVPAVSTANAIDVTRIISFSSSQEVRRAILSMRGAFVYIIEVVMLVTGLVGPIFVALSLFPFGSKLLTNWGASFLSLGFCKICFSLISGLSALAMVYAGPKNVDMLVVSVVLGLFAPILSFGIASGSGIGILNTISYVGQSYGVNTGMSSYKASRKVGQNSTSTAYD